MIKLWDKRLAFPPYVEPNSQGFTGLSTIVPNTVAPTIWLVPLGERVRFFYRWNPLNRWGWIAKGYSKNGLDKSEIGWAVSRRAALTAASEYQAEMAETVLL